MPQMINIPLNSGVASTNPAMDAYQEKTQIYDAERQKKQDEYDNNMLSAIKMAGDGHVDEARYFAQQKNLNVPEEIFNNSTFAYGIAKGAETYPKEPEKAHKFGLAFYSTQGDIPARYAAARAAAGDPITDLDYEYRKLEQELKLKQQYPKAAASGGSVPSAMQITDEMMDQYKIAANTTPGTPEHEEAVRRYNLLGQISKNYGFDRGMEYGEDYFQPFGGGASSPAQPPALPAAQLSAPSPSMPPSLPTSAPIASQGLVAPPPAAPTSALPPPTPGGPRVISGYDAAAAQIAGKKQDAKNQSDLQYARPIAVEKALGEKYPDASTGAAMMGGITGQMSGIYDQLEKAKAVVSTQNTVGENLSAAIRQSPPGQYIGKKVGTEEQSLRNQLAMFRPALINAIRQATGMSAKAMDSNAELQFYLQMATNPDVDVQANRAALQYLVNTYGIGGISMQKFGQGQPAPAAAPSALDHDQSLANARAAIARNPAARDAIINKLIQNGIDPRGL